MNNDYSTWVRTFVDRLKTKNNTIIETVSITIRGLGSACHPFFGLNQKLPFHRFFIDCKETESYRYTPVCGKIYQQLSERVLENLLPKSPSIKILFPKRLLRYSHILSGIPTHQFFLHDILMHCLILGFFNIKRF